MNLEEKMLKRAKITKQMQNYLDEHEDENGKMSSEDVAAYEAMENEIMELTNSIKRSERVQKIEDELNKPTSKPLTSAPNTKLKTGTATDDYYSAFNNYCKTGVIAKNVLIEGDKTKGGFLVPDEWDSRLIAALNKTCFVRELATIIKTEGTHRIPRRTSGFLGARVEEGEKLKWEDETFDEVVLNAWKYVVGARITDELLEDNKYDLEGDVLRQFSNNLNELTEGDFFIGDGNKKPAGLFDTAAGGEDAGTLTQALAADDIIDLIYALRKPYRKNATLILNDKTTKLLRKLKDNNGQYLWDFSLVAGAPDVFNGMPVQDSELVPENKIGFGDVSYYNIGDRGNKVVKRVDQLFVESGDVGYVMRFRTDAKLVLREAFKILTLSPAALKKSEANK